jgi:hypothetical protein
MRDRKCLEQASEGCPIVAEVVVALAASPKPKEVRVVPPTPIQGSKQPRFSGWILPK